MPAGTRNGILPQSFGGRPRPDDAARAREVLMKHNRSKLAKSDLFPRAIPPRPQAFHPVTLLISLTACAVLFDTASGADTVVRTVSCRHRKGRRDPYAAPLYRAPDYVL